MSRVAPHIRAGSAVIKDGIVYTVLDFVDLTSVVVTDNEGKHLVCNVSDLQSTVQANDPVRVEDLDYIGDEAWNRAFEIYRNLHVLLQLKPADRTVAEIKKVASVLGLSSSSVYRLLAAYKATGRISSLLRKRRSDVGVPRLSAQVVSIVNEGIEKHYLSQNRKSVASVWKEIDRACKAANLGTPTQTTVRSIIHRLDGATVEARRYSRKRSEETYAPLLGSFPNAQFPYAVIQIDHTPMDVIIVDDVHRKPIGRAFLTIALDVRSKMVTGFVVSIDNPGALATGLCISMSILPKDEWLRERGLEKHLTWPCYGFMRTIHTDNAKEFRGEMLRKACAEYSIIPERRVKGQPRYGGHVERAFRTFMQEVHEELPGTTFSNVRERADYDSEGKAVLTLAGLERWFAIYLLGRYHLTPHAGNDGMAPLDVWTKAHLEGLDGALPLGLPPHLSREKAERLRIDFLPFFEATVQQYGVKSWSIEWYSPRIQRFIAEKTPDGKGRTFICRYDPRDLHQIWFYDDRAREYITLPYRVASRPPVSLWEVSWAKKMLKDQGSPTNNEVLIFNSIDLARKIIADESALKKAANRKAQKRREWSKVGETRRPKKVTPVTDIEADEDLPLPSIDLLVGIREAS